MKIDRNNYEMYFIDYLEGELNQEQVTALMEFISLNSDLKNEFDEFSNYGELHEQEGFKLKDKLKKEFIDFEEITEQNIDEYCIAYIENDLSEDEKSKLEDATSNNSEYNKTLNLYRLTKLIPDLKIKYLQKRKLKHFVISRKSILRITQLSAVAAAVIIGMFILLPAREKITDNNSTEEIVIPVQKEISTPGVSVTKIYGKSNNSVITEKVTKVAKNNFIVAEAEKPLRESFDIKPLKLMEIKALKVNYLKENPIINARNPIENLALKPEENEPLEDKSNEPLIKIYRNRKINLLEIASIGVKAFSKLNETDFAFTPHVDKTGELQSITFETRKRRITTPLI